MAAQTDQGSAGATGKKSWTRFLPVVGRVLLGLLFTVTGLNGFLDFLPHPPTMPEFAVALAKTGYMFPLIMGTQLLVGLLLLCNRFVALALVLIAPVVVNIVAFHLFLDRGGLGMAIVVLLLEVGLVWAYRGCYRTMLAMKAGPGPG